jgi:hypothetical protein
MKDPGTALFLRLDSAPTEGKADLSADFADDTDFKIQICEIGVICGSPWPCASRRRWRTVKEVRLMRFLSTQHNAIEADASVCTTSSANGTAPASGYPRATALPCSKVRKLFEGAQGFRKVRILENPEDLFEDAHPFPRCARKTANLRAEYGAGPSTGPRGESRGQSGCRPACEVCRGFLRSERVNGAD